MNQARKRAEEAERLIRLAGRRKQLTQVAKTACDMLPMNRETDRLIEELLRRDTAVADRLAARILIGW